MKKLEKGNGCLWIKLGAVVALGKEHVVVGGDQHG